MEGATNPNDAESGPYGKTTAMPAQVKVVASRARAGLLFQNGVRLVRMTKTTSVWVSRDSMNHPDRNRSGLFARTEGDDEDCEGAEVEDGADRSEHRHEPADECDVPVCGAAELFVVDVVAGDGRLADVVEQVVEQDLGWQQRAGTGRSGRCRRG